MLFKSLNSYREAKITFSKKNNISQTVKKRAENIDWNVTYVRNVKENKDT